MKIATKIALSTLLTVGSLSAHSLWINSFESFAHKPGHTTVGLGWGHTLPIDDILNSPKGKVIIEKFTITTPDGEVIKLHIPENKTVDPTLETTNFDLYPADIGLQKIALKEDSKKGVYKIQAKSKPTFYTQYLDKKDRKRLKLKSKDELKDVKKVLMSVKYEAFANSYLTLGEWSAQKATNEGLEIIPKTDLSNVKVGDLVTFEVLFYGKPLSMSAKSKEFITAVSNSFGQNDGFSLLSYIKKGKAQIRVQSSGQWMVSCNHKGDVTKDGSLKALYGKADQVYHGASLTFNVQ